MLVSRRADEIEIFKRFLATLAEHQAAQWEYYGANHDRPDFVLLDAKIGIELAEWLHEERTAAAREMDRFEKEINDAVVAGGLTAFAKSFGRSAEERYMTLLQVNAVPRRKEKNLAIHLLLDFLQTAGKPKSAWEQKYGIIHADELPQAVKRFFGSIHLWCVPSDSLDLGINVNRASSFDPEEAVRALLLEIRSGRLGDCSPRLPRSRTCGSPASGSSAHGFAT